MKVFLGLVMIGWAVSSTAWAATIPVRWLEGPRGLEQALAIQQETKLPVLVWTTWNDCPYCGQVTAYLNKAKTRQALKDYPHVIIDEHGQPKEAALAKEKGFHGGYFYVLTPGATAAPKDRVWAWKPDSRVIVDNLEGALTAKLAAAKP